MSGNVSVNTKQTNKSAGNKEPCDLNHSNIEITGIHQSPLKEWYEIQSIENRNNSIFPMILPVKVRRILKIYKHFQSWKRSFRNLLF